MAFFFLNCALKIKPKMLFGKLAWAFALLDTVENSSLHYTMKTLIQVYLFRQHDVNIY